MKFEEILIGYFQVFTVDVGEIFDFDWLSSETLVIGGIGGATFRNINGYSSEDARVNFHPSVGPLSKSGEYSILGRVHLQRHFLSSFTKS